MNKYNCKKTSIDIYGMIENIKAIEDDNLRRDNILNLCKQYKTVLFDWVKENYSLDEDECEFVYSRRPCIDWENIEKLGDWFSKATIFYVNCKSFLEKRH